MLWRKESVLSVLLVDDEPQLLELAKMFLERVGDISTVSVDSAEAALEALGQHDFDAIVSDYQMPTMSGLDLLKAIREKELNIPFILFTGKGREDVAIEALNSGADFYLQKGGDPVSQFAELVNMIRSATAAKRSEVMLARSEELFRLLAENSRDLVYRMTLVPEMGFEYVSPSATRIIGYTPEEHYANPNLGLELAHPDDRAKIRELMTPKNDFSEPIVVRWITKDGRTIWTEQRIVPIKNEAGKIVAIEGTAIDVTARVTAEQELKASEAEYRKLVVTAPCLICSLDASGKTLFVNDYVRDATGYEPKEVMGRNWWEVFYPGHLRSQVDGLMMEFRKGDVSGYEMTMMDRDGAMRTILWNSFNTWADDGETLLGINGAGIDLTPRKAAEDALRESGAFNRAVLDSLDANIAVLDSSGRITAVNRSWSTFARLNGGGQSDTGVGSDYLAICDKAAGVGETDASTIAEAIRSTLGGARASFSLEYPCHSPEQKRWFLMQVSPLTRRRGGAVVSHIDITARKEMNEALRASEAHYRSIFETTGNAMVIIDENDTIVLVNSEFERLMGYSKAEVEGHMRWTEFIDKGDQERHRRFHERRRKDPESAQRSFNFRATDRFGAEKSLLANAAVVPGTGRTIISIVDETERRRYEDAIQQASKKMDLLARITRHDILNQLSVLYGYLELAQSRSDDEALVSVLEKARTASESIKRHLEFARDYQNMGTKRPQWIDVQAASKRAAANIEHPGVRFVTEVTGLEVFADPMLEKVFYNLLDNSIKHGVKTTKVTFRYSHGRDGMRLIYEDDGIGVPQDDKHAIFEKSVGDQQGWRGYGLYLAREILGITGITVEETGVQGEGARFEMLIPRGRYRTKSVTSNKRRAARGRGK